LPALRHDLERARLLPFGRKATKEMLGLQHANIVVNSWAKTEIPHSGEDGERKDLIWLASEMGDA
jgi:hypothetical protein